MSLSRTFINEFRPFFRLFDDISRSARAPFPVSARTNIDDFYHSSLRQPAVDLSEQGNIYIIEAELPGIKKENLEVRVGDNGRSVTIEGTKSQPQNVSTEAQSSEGTTSLTKEREFSSSQFSRIIWLPRSADASRVSGHFEDGILTLQIPKADEQGSVKVQIQ